ncbi:hypothetical protein [Photobacterium leiognathi]|uniref:hypothetical protein n=1 Tax=Photobacterium leiognathi TaxID=553611 RepID=UPI00298134F3|nr:hypothetical protein [Photobacterium leiognathi]
MNNNKKQKNSDNTHNERAKLLAYRAKMILKARDERGVSNQELISKAKEVASIRANSLNAEPKSSITTGKKLSREQLLKQIKSNKEKACAKA